MVLGHCFTYFRGPGSIEGVVGEAMTGGSAKRNSASGALGPACLQITGRALSAVYVLYYRVYIRWYGIPGPPKYVK